MEEGYSEIEQSDARLNWRHGNKNEINKLKKRNYKMNKNKEIKIRRFKSYRNMVRIKVKETNFL